MSQVPPEALMQPAANTEEPLTGHRGNETDKNRELRRGARRVTPPWGFPLDLYVGGSDSLTAGPDDSGGPRRGHAETQPSSPALMKPRRQELHVELEASHCSTFLIHIPCLSGVRARAEPGNHQKDDRSLEAATPRERGSSYSSGTQLSGMCS
ncbi:unnamed protein product [Pleuronectes platessa]|uniref:Uncharacterized protein n=1 Tax=Pleuronectes platessa TaxID=8262 RepID=A0A9N7TU53_PLEPL|nr:unnamed protein product [Pleuronectes platessa]